MESISKSQTNHKKRIALFIDSLGGGGAERVATVLCNNLVESGRYSVDIVMLRKNKIEYVLDKDISLYYAEDMKVTSFYAKIIRKAYLVYKIVRQSVFKPLMVKIGRYDDFPKLDETKFYYYAKYAMPYREYLKSNRLDVAIGFLVRSNIAMLMAAKGTGVKTIYCERNNPKRTDISPALICIRDRITCFCNAAVYQTVEQKAYYTWIKGKTEVIPNPIKEDLPEPYMGIRRHEIVNFCRLNKQKNIPLLIDAFALLHQEYPDHTLRIFGKGDERNSLLSYIEKKKLQEFIFIEDFAPDIHTLIRDAAMFVSTSDFEGISNSMLEAMAIGLPCVCTDCAGGGARMIIRDHVNGILVPVGDVQAVYNGMKEIIDNTELAKKLSKEAFKIREELSASKIVDQWEAMIK